MGPLLVLLAACAPKDAAGLPDDTGVDTGNDTDNDTDNDTGGGDSGLVTSCEGVVLDTSCHGAIELDAGSGVSVVDVPVSWSWSAECQASVASPIYVRVPDDVTSLQVTVLAGNASTYAQVVVDGTTIEDRAPGNDVEPHHLRPAPAQSRLWPTTPDAPLSPGCWAVLPRATDPTVTEGEVYVHARRGDPTAGTLAVVGILVGDVPLDDAGVDSILSIAQEWYSRGGVTLEVAPTERLDFDIGAALDLSEGRMDLLRAWTDPEGTGAVPVFFAREFASGGVIGMAGGIPGAPLAGTASSGVVVTVEPYVNAGDGSVDTVTLGQVVGHEIGHQIGLWHTSESTGLYHDFLGDTPECPPEADTDGNGNVGGDECAAYDASNIMFWQSSGSAEQDVFSADQLWMIAHSPMVRGE